MNTTGENDPPKVIKRPPPPVPSRSGLSKFGTPPKLNETPLSNSLPATLPVSSLGIPNIQLPPPLVNQNNNQNIEPLSPNSQSEHITIVDNNHTISDEKEEKEEREKLQQQKTVNALTISSLRGAINEGSEKQVNWENFENLFKKAQEEEKELDDLFDLSQYDFEVASVLRKDIGKEQISYLEEALNDSRLPSFSKECINFFLKPYKQVKGSYFDQSLDTSTTNTQRRNRRTKVLNPNESNVLHKNIDNTLKDTTKLERTVSAASIGPSNSSTSGINLEAILSKRLALIKLEENGNPTNNSNTPPNNTNNNNNSNNNAPNPPIKVVPNPLPKLPGSGSGLLPNPNVAKHSNTIAGSKSIPNTTIQPPPRRPPAKAPPKTPGSQDPPTPAAKPPAPIPEKKEVKKEDLIIPDIDLSLLDCNQEERMKIIRDTVAENTPKDLFLAVDHEKEVKSALNTPPFFYKTSKRLKIEFKELSLPVDELFFCSVSLHDIKLKVRVSELFYFDFMPDDKNHLTPKSRNLTTSCRECFIPVHYDNITDLVLIIRIQKLFKGDIEKDILFYMKGKSSKKGQVEKLKVENQEIPPDLGLVLQPFLWVPLSLADETGKVRTGDIAIDEFRPLRTLCSDEHIYEQLYREIEGKKGKMIPGNLVLSMGNVSEDIHGLVSPSLVAANSKNVYKITREIQWMGQTQCPDLTYVNNLYIIPHSVNIKQHQNIQISVEFKADESDSPLTSIYGTYGADNFVTLARTAVTYKEKKPQFFDEFKINLPCILTPKHHLLFTFHNLGATRELIGYAIFPLFSPAKGITKSDKYTVHLFLELAPNYLELHQNDGLKWILGKQSTFSFSSKLISSVYPEDDRIIQLSTLLDSGKEYDNSYVEALANLQKIPPPVCMKHFPPILNIIFQLLCSGNDMIGKEAMGCLSKILKGVKMYSNEKSSHNSFLLSYARYVFDNPQYVSSYEPICKYWLQHLEEKNPNFQDLGQTWVLLDIIIKSMMLKLCENGKPEPSARLTTFSKEFLDNLKKLVNALFCVPIGNMDILTLVPLFMKDLLVVMNRGLVFEMIFKYIAWLNNENHTGDVFLATVKFTFIKIITDYKHYIPLNIPTEIKLSEDSSSTVQNFWLNHFFSGMLIREVRAGLLQKQRIREQSISTLSSLLHSHDMDVRYSDPLRRQRIAGLYFPFVITAVEFLQVLEDYLVEEEKMNWLLCFFYIVKNCNRNLLRQWWTTETEQRQEKFFAMMEMGIIIFKDHELFNPMCFIILDLLLEFIILFKDLLNRQDNSVLTRIFHIIQKLQDNRSTTFIVCMMNLMKVIIDTLAQPLFSHKSLAFCQSLAFDILQHLNSDLPLIRSKACALFYYFLQKNYEEAKNVNRVQLQYTISISRLVAESKLQKNNNYIQTSLKIIKEFAQKSPNLDFNVVKDTIKEIKKLMLYSQQLQQYKDSPEMIAELYLKISNSNKDSPDVRITWLDELARKHSNNNMWCEAALVRAVIGAMIAQYLNLTSVSPVDIRSFRTIIPNCDIAMISPELAKTLDGTSSNWSLDGFVRVIERAILLMKQAKQYELCIELYSMLVLAYKNTLNHAKLIDCLTEFKLMTEVLIQTNKDLRIFATYFRVSFYGKLFEEQEGKQYVYKFGPKENLMTIQQYFKSTLTKTFNKTEEEIEVLGNADVDKSKLDPNKLYLQVAMVLPYVDPSEEETRNTAFAKNFNLKSFLFESAFNDGNQQSKKKTIFHISNSFPNLLCRFEVIDTTEIILSPLESSIDLIKDRITRFDLELNVMFKDVRVNQLQQLLQGSVVPMVNEGPLKICETFLSKEERGKYPKEQIKELETLMIKFVKMCGFGVKLSGQVIDARELSEYQQFQNMIDLHYRGMKEKTSVYFNID